LDAKKTMLLRAMLFVLMHVAVLGAVLSFGTDPPEMTALLLDAR
jgi:hypothetical protein